MLGMDQRTLAELSGLSLPTIQRMEASDGVVRGNVDSLMKLVGALQKAGVKPTFIFSGKYKVETNPYEPLSAEAITTRVQRRLRVISSASMTT